METGYCLLATATDIRATNKKVRATGLLMLLKPLPLRWMTLHNIYIGTVSKRLDNTETICDKANQRRRRAALRIANSPEQTIINKTAGDNSQCPIRPQTTNPNDPPDIVNNRTDHTLRMRCTFPSSKANDKRRTPLNDTPMPQSWTNILTNVLSNERAPTPSGPRNKAAHLLRISEATTFTA